MTLKDDGSETISKNVVDWLSQLGGLISAISGIAAALAAIFGLFFPNLGDDAQRITLGLAGVLAIGSGAVYFYQRRRAEKLKIAESLEPLSATAALRGLLPFEVGDKLPGRGRDVQDLYTLVSSRAVRFGVLWGESGCGKTSLLRAGLVPKLREENYLPLYIHKPTNDPQEAIRSALTKELGGSTKKSEKDLRSQLKTAAPKGRKVIVLLDQFEEFFLTNRTPSSRVGFIKWLGSIVNDENLPIVFLVGIRGDFFVQLQNFSPQISEPTSTRSTYQLQNFETEQAKQIFSAAAKADGIQFEPELIQAVIKELEVEDFIRPAELQVVGTRLKRKNITRLSQYEALGGARGILSSYISDEIKQSANEQAARLVLRLMCADAVETKSPTDLDMEDILRGVSGSGDTSQHSTVKQEEIQKILNQFVAARVLIKTEENKYNLAHDYLASYVHTATGGVETNTKRANDLLKQYVADYKVDKRTRIPFGRVRLIQKFASRELVIKDNAQELIKKSKRAFYALVTALTIPLILLLGLYFLYLTNAYYLSVENSYVVLRAGSPQFTFLPGFGEVVIQTDFRREDLDDIMRNEIDQGEVTGFWFNHAQEGYELWGEQLATRLPLIQQAQMFRLLGNPNRANEILMGIINDPIADYSLKLDAINALGSLAQTQPQSFASHMLETLITMITGSESGDLDSDDAASVLASVAQAKPQAVTSEMLQTVMDFITDPKMDSAYLKINAIEALGVLARAKPQAVTSDMLQSVMAFITDPKVDSSSKINAINALGALAQAKPQAATSDMLQAVMTFVTDSYQRSSTLESLRSLAQAKPQAVTSDMLETLVAIITDPKADSSLRSDAIKALGSLAQAQPQAVTSDMLQAVMAFITDPTMATDPRSSALDALGVLAQAEAQTFTSDMLETLVAIITDPPSDSFLRTSTLDALESFAQAKPQAVTSDMLERLISIITDPKASFSKRSSAIIALETLTQAKPQAVTSDKLQNAMNFVTNPTSDSFLRSDAIEALGVLARAKPQAVTSDLLEILIAIITDPNSNSGSRSDAIEAVGVLAQARPGAVSSDMFNRFIATITDPRASFPERDNALSALWALAQAKPQSVTSDMLQNVMHFVGNPSIENYQRSDGISALAALAQAKPQAVTADMWPTVMGFVSHYPYPPFNRIKALEALTQANPHAVTSDVLQSVIYFITDPTTENYQRSDVLDGLGVLAQTNPEVITLGMLERLTATITNPNSDFSLRSDALEALGLLIAANPQAATSNGIEYSLYLLKSDTDSSAREAAAYSLFMIALGNTEQGHILRKELDELQTGTHSQWRMAASRILEMLEIGDLVEEARAHPVQIESIKSRLNYLINLDESFNEQHLQFAAQIALQEIEKIEAENK